MSITSKKPPSDLDEWLSYLESIHPKNIELGLDRVNQVFKRLKLDFSSIKVITVAGTNGKGTTCAMVEHAVLLANKNVAVYSSPHLVDYRERVRVNNKMLDPEAHCAAFSEIENARGDIALTYFEFGTLAGLYLIANAKPDVALLEVGLGGRLDAINIVDPDLAVITTIGLDHQDWLGDTKEQIAIEKAGIFREHGTAIIGEIQPPCTLSDEVDRLRVDAKWQNTDFSLIPVKGKLKFSDPIAISSDLPVPHIPIQNAATAIMVTQWLSLGLSDQQYIELMNDVRLPGRCQVIQRSPTVMLDVAHNQQAAQYLADQIATLKYTRVKLVVAMLADKDIEQTLLPMQQLECDWYVAPLDIPRGAKSQQLKSVLNGQQMVLECCSIADAYSRALTEADCDDLVVVFGSFYTVAEVMQGAHLMHS